MTAYKGINSASSGSVRTGKRRTLASKHVQVCYKIVDLFVFHSGCCGTDMDCQVKRLEDRLENLLETVDTMASSMATMTAVNHAMNSSMEAMTAVNHAMNSSMEEMAKIILTMNSSMNATSTLGDLTIIHT